MSRKTGQKALEALACVALACAALAGCKNTILDAIAHQYDEAGGFEPTFTASAESFLVSDSVTFTNSTLTDVKSIHWDFGDGATLDNSNVVVHKYTQKGIYTVTMTATSTHGTTRTFQTTVYALGTEPNVTVSTPAAGAWLGSNDVAVTSLSVDKFSTSPDSRTIGVKSLALKVDGVTVMNYTLAQADTDASQGAGFTYTFHWDSTGVSDGPHTLTVAATDLDTGGGQVGTADVVINTDNTAPTLSSVSVASAATYTTSTTVDVAMTANDGTGSGLASMAFSNDNVTWSGWETWSATKTGWALASGADGTRTVYVKVRDAMGNASNAANDAITLDTTAPTVTLIIAGGAAATTGLSVNLGITSSDATSGTYQMRFENSGGSWSAWEAAGIAHNGWTLPPGEAIKTVLAQVSDNAGNVGQASDTIVYDVTPPTAGTLQINSGATWTSSTAVTLTNSASDSGSGLYQMQFKDGGGSYNTAAAYAASAPYTIGSTQGSHTITAQYFDYAGNPVTTTASISLDNVNPTTPTVTLSDPGTSSTTYADSTTVNIAISSTDATSGLSGGKMRFSNNGSSWSSWEAYSGTKSGWTLAAGGDGSRTVWVQTQDVAGNISASGSDSIVLDTAAPTISSFTINAGAAWSTSATVTLSTSASDAGSGMYQMRFSNDGSAWGSWVAFASATGWNLSAGEGAKTVFAQFTDNRGRQSSASDTIGLDTIKPSLPAVVVAGGAPFTTSMSVSLTGIGSVDSGSGLFQMQFSNDVGVSWSGLQPYGASVTTWGLAGGADGPRTVSVRVTDVAGNVSSMYTSAPITLDQNPPSNLAFSIPSNPTPSTTVSLSINETDGTGTGVAQMRFSNDGGATWSSWQPYNTTATWTLAPMAGAYAGKSVAAQFRDGAGFTSTGTVNANTTYQPDWSMVTKNDVLGSTVNPSYINAWELSASKIVVFVTGSTAAVMHVTDTSSGTLTFDIVGYYLSNGSQAYLLNGVTMGTSGDWFDLDSGSLDSGVQWFSWDQYTGLQPWNGAQAGLYN